MDILPAIVTTGSSLIVGGATAYIAAYFTRRSEREKWEQQLKLEREAALRTVALEREKWERAKAAEIERWQKDHDADIAKRNQDLALARAAARAGARPEAAAIAAQAAIGYFVIDYGDHDRDRVFIAPADRLVCGRDSANDIVLQTRLSSRRHFALEAVGGRVYVVDFGSTNSTFVNGARVDGRCELRTDDVITIGAEAFPKLVFRYL